MPNTGDREAYVASMVKSALTHPKAALLTAIGAISPTPSEATKAARDLGFADEAIKFARWIAVFKRGKPRADFLKGLLEITKQPEKKTAITPPEITEMPKTQVKKGAEYFMDKVFKLLAEIYKAEKRDIIIYGGEKPTAVLNAGTMQVFLPSGKRILTIVSAQYASLFNDEGFSPEVELRVENPKAMRGAKRLKRRLDGLARRIQGKPTEFNIIQDYS